jgi:hypothetical protein
MQVMYHGERIVLVLWAQRFRENGLNLQRTKGCRFGSYAVVIRQFVVDRVLALPRRITGFWEVRKSGRFGRWKRCVSDLDGGTIVLDPVGQSPSRFWSASLTRSFTLASILVKSSARTASGSSMGSIVTFSYVADGLASMLSVIGSAFEADSASPGACVRFSSLPDSSGSDSMVRRAIGPASPFGVWFDK